MKLFAVFAAVLALSAAAAPTTEWTLHQLSEALQNPATPAGLIPYLEAALNAMMESSFAGKPLETITVSTPGGLLPVEIVNPIVLEPNTQWTLQELSDALQNPATPAELMPYLEHALNSMMESIFAGRPIETITVSTPGGLLPVEAITPIVPEPNTQWTLQELSNALQNPATPAELMPYLEQALNAMMESIFAGKPLETITVSTPGGLLPVEAITPIVPEPNTQWTLQELSDALQNPATPAELMPYLEHALNSMMESIFAGKPLETITVSTPGGLLPVEAITPIVLEPNTQWTLQELSDALQNPATPAELMPYLEHALNSMMESIFAGRPIETIAVPIPGGLLPVDAIPAPVAVAPVEVVEEPIAPAPVAPAPAPVAPETPAVVADASGSPLVQIIVNIKSQVAAAETPAAVESPVLVPSPVIVAPGPAVVPSPVIVVPQPENPLDIISINPVLPGPAVVPSPIVVAPEHPIDVIAVGQPDINPIDLLQPVPVAVAGGAPQGILV